MKKINSVLAILAAGALCAGFCACTGGPGFENGFHPDYGVSPDYGDGNYDYESVIENGFSDVSENPSSYFSLDRNTATYSLIRKQIERGLTVSPDSVRIEEMLNYFDYDFKAPTEEAVAVSSYIAPCPWNEENLLMLAGVKTAEYKVDSTVNNYVFLVDVSGSMDGTERIGLAKYGLTKLVDSLGENDVVSMVTYASGVKTVLDSKECTENNKDRIKSAVNNLRAYGATNGGDGLQRAYALANKNFRQGGNNRVILISDGDFNVGMTSTSDLKEFIQTKAKSGVYLSVLGVGLGNMRDTNLETLARCGNGNYAYLDNKTEAEKVLIHELNGTLTTVAKDAKAGVTFTENVEKYRLIGYDTKILSEDDFNDDKTDAGEIGSNLCVSALYEIKVSDAAIENAKLADIEIKYKDVRGETELSKNVTCMVMLGAPSSDDLSFISCVAEFGLILRQSKYKGEASIDNVLTRLETLSEYISGDIYKQEFKSLVYKASENENYTKQ